MNSVVPIVGGLVILACVVIGPIYCVVRLAGFKKRNKAVWGLSAIMAIVPAFIVLSLLPSLRAESEKESYSVKFTRQHDRPGYILAFVFSVLLIALYYLRYVSNPSIHSLQNSWLHLHFILLSMACSAVLAAFVLSFIRLWGNSNFPAVILVLQKAIVILLFSSIIAGTIWAHAAFGSYWSWDPKETWSLILLSISILVYTYFCLRVPNRVFQFLASTAHVGVFIFLILGVPYLLPGLWSGIL